MRREWRQRKRTEKDRERGERREEVSEEHVGRKGRGGEREGGLLYKPGSYLAVAR